MSLEKFDSALAVCEQLIHDLPESWSVYRRKADILEAMNERNQALTVREHLTKVGTEEPADFYDLTRLCVSLQRYKEAIKWAEKCISLCAIHDNFYYYNAAYFYKSFSELKLMRFGESIDTSAHLKDGYSTYINGYGVVTKEDIILEAKINIGKRQY
ncbi:MAG: hypothetical protein HY080_02520 [Gammaproteobacteria bacterium]|nr:hypothetical protein [Gammaproteobacteria bacterium]